VGEAKGGKSMRQKLKPDYDPESIQSDLVETVCFKYKPGVSVRAIAKEMELSPMKVRKILITGGVYSTDLSTEIGELYKDGKTVSEIAELLYTTTANVNSYLPYERIIYNMEERSTEADRQARYRERLRSGVKEEKPEMPKIERVRNRTIVIVIGRKLRSILPKEIYDDVSDPLAREKSYTLGTNISGEFVLHEPTDPDKMIWCAEVTTSGRGKNKKQGIVLMSANCGFAVISAFPPFTPADPNYLTGEELKAFRAELEKTCLASIRSGLLSFSLPENHVLDYTDTVARIELVKGKPSFPATRLEELIEQELEWKNGVDPLEYFNVRGNWTSRKYGNSTVYRPVEIALQQMLEMSEDEYRKWQVDFLAPIREKLNNGANSEQ